MTETKRNLVVISGYYGFDNLGDEAILEELISELKELVNPNQIVVLSNNPTKTAELYQVKAINRWHPKTILAHLAQTKLFISGGGSLFHDITSIKSVLYYSALVLAAKFFGARIFMYAQGIGPLKHKISQWLTHLAWEQADQGTVRDQASLQLAQSWNIPVQLTADPVWSLQPQSLPSQLANLSTLQKENGKFLVGISLRSNPLFNDDYLPALAKAIKESFPEQTRILLLPLQKKHDQPILQSLADNCAKLKIETEFLNLDSLVKPSQWLSLMGKLDILIGMRYHALLMALKAGVCVTGLPYDPKVTHLCNVFQQPLLPFEESQTDSWTIILKKTYLERTLLTQAAKEQTAREEISAKKNFQILTSLLKS